MDAYERLLGDALKGDSTLFAREDYVEEAWRIVDPVLKSDLQVSMYQPNTWGPRGRSEGLARRRLAKPHRHRPTRAVRMLIESLRSDQMDTSAPKRRILVLGGGFGGVYTARHLERLVSAARMSKSSW